MSKLDEYRAAVSGIVEEIAKLDGEVSEASTKFAGLIEVVSATIGSEGAAVDQAVNGLLAAASTSVGECIGSLKQAKEDLATYRDSL